MKQLDEGHIDSMADMKNELNHAMELIDSSSNRTSVIHDYRQVLPITSIHTYIYTGSPNYILFALSCT